MTVILIIDLEATCFENCEIADMEIIEIGACIATPSGEVLDRLSTLVKPEKTIVTRYCTELTGLSVDDLAKAPSLQTAFLQLEHWLDHCELKPDYWMSWGVFDAQLINQECANKNIKVTLPAHHCAKTLFQKRLLPKRRRVGLKKALDICGLRFEGRPHRALNDALNVARLLPYFMAISQGQTKGFPRGKPKPDLEHMRVEWRDFEGERVAQKLQELLAKGWRLKGPEGCKPGMFTTLYWQDLSRKT